MNDGAPGSNGRRHYIVDDFEMFRELPVVSGTATGYVERVEQHHTLEDVRNMILEQWDENMLPSQTGFYFCISGTRVMSKQEKNKSAWDLLTTQDSDRARSDRPTLSIHPVQPQRVSPAQVPESNDRKRSHTSGAPNESYRSESSAASTSAAIAAAAMLAQEDLEETIILRSFPPYDPKRQKGDDDANMGPPTTVTQFSTALRATCSIPPCMETYKKEVMDDKISEYMKCSTPNCTFKLRLVTPVPTVPKKPIIETIGIHNHHVETWLEYYTAMAKKMKTTTLKKKGKTSPVAIARSATGASIRSVDPIAPAYAASIPPEVESSPPSASPAASQGEESSSTPSESAAITRTLMLPPDIAAFLGALTFHTDDQTTLDPNVIWAKLSDHFVQSSHPLFVPTQDDEDDESEEEEGDEDGDGCADGGDDDDDEDDDDHDTWDNITSIRDLLKLQVQERVLQVNQNRMERRVIR